MKKLLVLLGIAFSAFALSFSFKGNMQVVRAEESEITETTEEEPQEDVSSEEETTTTETTTEEIVEEEKEDVSQTAKDIKEVITTFFSQPLVIAGVSTTLGTIILSVFGKIIITFLLNKTSKYQREIDDLEDLVEELTSQLDLTKADLEVFKTAIRELISSNKNIRVKRKLLGIIEPKVEEIKDKVDVVKEEEQIKIKVKVK